MLLRLSSTEYQRLVEVAHTTHDPRALHRAQALLWLHEGDTVEEVATRLFTTPRTVYTQRYTQLYTVPVDGGSGRPAAPGLP